MIYWNINVFLSSLHCLPPPHVNQVAWASCFGDSCQQKQSAAHGSSGSCEEMLLGVLGEGERGGKEQFSGMGRKERSEAGAAWGRDQGMHLLGTFSKSGTFCSLWMSLWLWEAVSLLWQLPKEIKRPNGDGSWCPQEGGTLGLGTWVSVEFCLPCRTSKESRSSVQGVTVEVDLEESGVS